MDQSANQNSNSGAGDIIPENIPLSEEGVELTHEPAAPQGDTGVPEVEESKPEQTIDLEKELGEDIHLTKAAPAPKPPPPPNPSLADALKTVQTERKPGEPRPFVPAAPLRDIPNVPSAAAPKPPQQEPAPAVTPPPAAAAPVPPAPEKPLQSEGVLARMHPEAAPTPKTATPAQADMRTAPAANAASVLQSLERRPTPAPTAPSLPQKPGVPEPPKPIVPATPATSVPHPAPIAAKAQPGPTITGAPKRTSVLEQLRELASSPLHPLRTYRTDAEETVKTQRTSIVTMAAAEQERRARTASSPAAAPAPRTPMPWGRIFVWTLIAMFLVGGAAAALYIYIGPPAVDAPTQVQASNILFIDESVEQPLSSLDHLGLLGALTKLRDETSLSIGLMREVYFTLPTEAIGDGEPGKRLASTQEVFARLAPNMPPALLRAMQPEFVLGVHVFDNNQGFVVLKTDNYQQAYSGMLEWEHAMRGDLMPFIDRRPRARLPNEATNSTTTPRVIASSFVDAVVRNHDARVLYNDAGDTVLLYSFLDQRTIAIATNENTLFELASRLREVRF